ncbi:hypothetical protein [Zoogloea dura]|uniref:Uncharacterized protein n=1 Tax=Zoogloea dura TaxID=2728840 RepID=A0A848G893_9RHOO|nr:hypothetical protein [Zoogloea dura]NML27382.1 hypothetical protein [Zoogloea dura]
MSKIPTVILMVCVLGTSVACDERGQRSTAGHTSQTAPSASAPPLAAEVSAATSNIESCRTLLQRVPLEWDRAQLIRQVLNTNIHWQGAPHHVFPKRLSVQSDIDAAFSAMDVIDVPILVSLIGSGELGSGELGLASGVLLRFGPKALPCVEAGIDFYRAQRASDLSAIRINIEVEHHSDTTTRRKQP